MVTKFTKFRLVFDRKNQIDVKDKESLGTIEIEMSLDGKRKLAVTPYRITKEQWHVKKKVPKDALMLRNLETLISELKTFETEFIAVNKTFTLNDFKAKDEPIQAIPQKKVSFTDFIKEQLAGEIALKQPSLQTRKLSFDYFKRFKENVRFDELNFNLIQSFDLFLHAQKASGRKLHLNTIHKHHKHLRKYILLAIKHRFMAGIDNPYNDFKART